MILLCLIFTNPDFSERLFFRSFSSPLSFKLLSNFFRLSIFIFTIPLNFICALLRLAPYVAFVVFVAWFIALCVCCVVLTCL
ncbi:hypothetical protein [Staphylococcus phage PT1-4]